ncbi:MAG: ATP-dependent Clp protease adapter ClpS [Cellulomonadaceae bacterium]
MFATTSTPTVVGAAQGATEVEASAREAVATEDVWMTIVWNDPVNLMTYVSYVFESYFGYSEKHAERLMLQVHHEGKAVVSSGGRERIERDVQAMHGYGLWATMRRADG